jgi:hypothetical protein
MTKKTEQPVPAPAGLPVKPAAKQPKKARRPGPGAPSKFWDNQPKNAHPYGPAMSELPPLQQRWVELMVLQPNVAHYKNLIQAGYQGREATAGTLCCNWLKKQVVRDALIEASRARIQHIVPDAVKALEEVINDPKHPHRTKATVALLDRAGLHAVSESKQTITHIHSDDELKQKLIAIASKIDLSRLLTSAVKPEPTPVIVDAEFKDVGGSSD